MLTILVVDDEKLERKGIRFLDMVSLNMRKRQWLPAFQTMC